MVSEVVITVQAEADLYDLIDFLVQSHLPFESSLEDAVGKATDRAVALRAEARKLGRAPHQGTRDPHPGPGVRHVTKGQAVSYFVTDDAAERLAILAIFWGGQDHRRRMLPRVLGDAENGGWPPAEGSD